MPKTLKRQKERMKALNQKCKNLLSRADKANRELTDAENVDFTMAQQEFNSISRDVERRESISNQEKTLRTPAGRKTMPTNTATKTKSKKKAFARAKDPKGGFADLGEYAMMVARASAKNAVPDDRLKVFMAPTTTGKEGTGADGGFAVPPDFHEQIMKKVEEEPNIYSMVSKVQTGSNAFTFPKDETTPWQTSGGILAYWEAEASQATQSKPALEIETVRLNKLFALVPISEELLDDAPGLSSYLQAKAPEKIRFKLDLAVVQGTGVGQPEGFLNHKATVSVAKEGSQTADTINYTNIIKMWSRMYAPCRFNAVWLINQDVEPQLFLLEFPGATSNVPAYLPPGGLSATPYGTLFNRPVIPHQACETVGDLGDICLFDPTSYMAVEKAGGMRAETSIHLWFDYDVMAFRWILRVGGRPWWSTAITSRDGSNTLGCAVTLAERA